MSSSFFDTKVEFLKGVGPQKAKLLNTELSIFTFGELIQHYPFRYEDRTVFYTIKQVTEEQTAVQLKGKLIHFEILGEGPKKRLTAYFRDETGEIELIWFRGIQWVEKSLQRGVEYVVYGRPTWYKGSFNIAHPELEPLTMATDKGGQFHPIYHSTEKLKNFGLDSKGISKAMKMLVDQAKPYLKETLPDFLTNHWSLITKGDAVEGVHFPKNQVELSRAQFRLKFEELFYNQLKILRLQSGRKAQNRGLAIGQIPLVNEFYKNHLPFDLTNAQKRVIREIYEDMKTGRQMNRLLQGDVGSGKTIVAFIIMLMAIDNGAQTCLMAPTEILADQHFKGLKVFAEMLGITLSQLTGSSKKSHRAEVHAALLSGELKILVGTHALLEDVVQFKNLGLCVIDEQHRFGVAQRAKLWSKNNTNIFPHILVMTATPIPRTLAMTFYGDLDVSVIDELPAGRKPIKTVHRFESQRLAVFGFIRQEIALGRQIYIVYPLIEESEKMDLADLYNGYEALLRDFPRPDYQICMVHGRMSAKEKEFEMQRFVRNETQIMVATTVIEVGVNVPNASVMIVENAERFGLAQLHQLRGRVGRGADQSYCILMSGNKVSQESREKIATMVRTNNGFEIAEADLQLRGPGDLMGTQQSGVLDLLIANLATDQEILKNARQAAQEIVDKDRELTLPEHKNIRQHIDSLNKNVVNWSRIS